MMVRSGTDVGCGRATVEPMAPSHLMAADSERVGQGSPVYLTSLSLTQGSAKKDDKEELRQTAHLLQGRRLHQTREKNPTECPASPSTKLPDNLAKSTRRARHT